MMIVSIASRKTAIGRLVRRKLGVFWLANPPRHKFGHLRVYNKHPVEFGTPTISRPRTLLFENQVFPASIVRIGPRIGDCGDSFHASSLPN